MQNCLYAGSESCPAKVDSARRYQALRSPDPSAAPLTHILDVLIQAGNALALCPDIDAALSQIAGSFVQDFCDYFSIEVAIEAVERYEFRATAGTREGDPGAERTIVEPLSDGRYTVGTITCHTSSPSGFDDVVRQAVHLLAIQLAVVLAGQVSMLREHRVADRLQRALLPDRLPALADAQFHAAYRPASAEAEVGGDWFDAFNLSGRRVGISVGDVAGHGLDAAVIMGEVRQSIRTAAISVMSPAQVLAHVNQVVAMRESPGMVTAIYGIYDIETSVLSYAVAGHPPPLLALANGLVRRLPYGGLPLGCAPTINSRDWTFTLPAGAHAVFYTDGLIENDRDSIAGEERLVEVVRSIVCEERPDGLRVSDPALAIAERVFDGAANRDDAAILLLSRSAPVAEYMMSAVPVAAPIARAIIESALVSLGIDSARRFDLLVAIGEAVANAIEHAYRDDATRIDSLRTSKPSSRAGDDDRGLRLLAPVRRPGRARARHRADVRVDRQHEDSHERRFHEDRFKSGVRVLGTTLAPRAGNAAKGAKQAPTTPPLDCCTHWRFSACFFFETSSFSLHSRPHWPPGLPDVPAAILFCRLAPAPAPPMPARQAIPALGSSRKPGVNRPISCRWPTL